VLASVGLELSGAIRLFLTQVVVHRGLPFEVRQPNAGTIRAMRQARAIASPRFASATELFDELEGRKDRKARRAAAKK
jgi:DNA-damage-inducible protein J